MTKFELSTAGKARSRHCAGNITKVNVCTFFIEGGGL